MFALASIADIASVFDLPQNRALNAEVGYLSPSEPRHYARDGLPYSSARIGPGSCAILLHASGPINFCTHDCILERQSGHFSKQLTDIDLSQSRRPAFGYSLLSCR